MIHIITGVSWSWKTTLVNYLVDKHKFKTLYNYTTRKPRNDGEKDEYIFLSPKTFLRKLINWDFLEFTIYNKNLYALWWVDKEMVENEDYIVVVWPSGREQLIEQCVRKWIKYKTYYLTLEANKQKERLLLRWDDIKTIEERQLDYQFFFPDKKAIKIDWEQDVETIAYNHFINE